MTMNYGNLDEAQRDRALDTKMYLDLLVFLNKIDEKLLSGRVLDFGAGTGVSTQALNNFSNNVEAVDISDSIDHIIERGILPPERAHKTDGIQFLREHPNTYDVVAAFWFGPLPTERDRQFLKEFYQAACVGVKPEGRILITSDIGSFRYIEKELAGKGEIMKFPGFLPAYLGKKSAEVA